MSVCTDKCLQPTVKTRWRFSHGVGLHLSHWCWEFCQNIWTQYLPPPTQKTPPKHQIFDLTCNLTGSGLIFQQDDAKNTANNCIKNGLASPEPLCEGKLLYSLCKYLCKKWEKHQDSMLSDSSDTQLDSGSSFRMMIVENILTVNITSN